MNDLIQKGFIPFGFKFTHLEIAKFFIEQNDYFTVNCVRDRSGKPTAALIMPQKVRHYLGHFLWKEKESMITHLN